MSHASQPEIRPTCEPKQYVDMTTDYNANWGYSIFHEIGLDGQYSDDSNTVKFRIYPGGMTEPEYVKKNDHDGTFKVTVLAGHGMLIKSRPNGEITVSSIYEGSDFIIKQDEAYVYKNLSQDEDLVLIDTATPAFKSGDDIDLTRSQVPQNTQQKPRSKQGFLAFLANQSESSNNILELPSYFFEMIGELAVTA